MQTVKLGQIFSNLKIGGTPSRGNYEYFGGGIPWVSVKDLSRGKIIEETSETLSKKGVENSSVKLIEKGSLMVSFKLTLGRVGFAGTDLYTNEAIASLEPSDVNIDVNFNYLYYALPGLLNGIIRTNNFGAGLLNKSILKEIEIPLPSLETQKAIAHKLEKIKNLIEQKKQIIQKTDELTKSIFIDMFGDPYLNPKGWETNRIGDISHSDIKKESEKDLYNKTINYISIASINNNKKEIDFIEELGKGKKPSRARQKVQNKDLLISTVRPNLNGVAIIKSFNDNLIASTGFCVIRPVNEYLVYYLFEVVKSSFFIKNMAKVAKGASYPAITEKDIKELKIPIPPLELQQKFADIVSKIEQQKQQYQQSLEKLQELYNSTLQESFRF